jgi:hypothetical protein
VDAHDDRPGVDFAGHPAIGGVLWDFDEIESVKFVELPDGGEAGEIPFKPMPDGRVNPIHQLGEGMPVEPAGDAAAGGDIVLGGDAMNRDVGLIGVRQMGRPGDDMDLVPGICERAGEAEHVGADAAEPALRRVFIGDQADAHRGIVIGERRRLNKAGAVMIVIGR